MGSFRMVPGKGKGVLILQLIKEGFESEYSKKENENKFKQILFAKYLIF